MVNGRAIVGGGNYNVIAAICRASGATTVFDPGYDPVGGHASHVPCGCD